MMQYCLYKNEDIRVWIETAAVLQNVYFLIQLNYVGTKIEGFHETEWFMSFQIRTFFLEKPIISKHGMKYKVR